MEKNGIQKKIFASVVKILEERGLILKKGTIVDSTLIAAPSSTKNRSKKRDTKAHSTKKGNQWHFGYKGHIGVDEESGLVHHVKVTPANTADVTAVPISKNTISGSAKTDRQTEYHVRIGESVSG